ncbi:MAG: hypothetical protein QXG73_02890 [Candidatus Micrarchaeaceae archaeon]
MISISTITTLGSIITALGSIIATLGSIIATLFGGYRPLFAITLIHASKKKVLQKLYYVSHNFQEHFASNLTPLLPPRKFLKPMLAAVLVMVVSFCVILILILEVPMQIPLPRHVLAMIILIWIFIMTFIIPIPLKAILEAKFKKELSKNSTSDEYRNLIDYSITSMGRYTILFQFLLLVFMVIIISINMPFYFLITFLVAAFEFALIGSIVYLFYEGEYYKPLDSILANIFKDNFTNTKTNTHKHAIYIAVITKYENHKEFSGRVVDIDKYLVIEDRNKRIPIDWHAIKRIELVKEK